MAGQVLRRPGLAAVLVLTAALSACGGGSSGGGASAGSGSGTTTGTTPEDQTVALANKGTSDIASYYAGLPHTSRVSDLQALATYMTSSGDFSEATVVAGGISAILPDGTPFVEFADTIDDGLPSTTGTPSAAGDIRAIAKSSAPAGSAAASTVASWPLTPANSHEYAFLVNLSDPAFAAVFQQNLAVSWQNSTVNASTYGVDFLDISLANIEALGSGHPIDLLHINTHGTSAFSGPNKTNPRYYQLSTTSISASLALKYKSDLQANNLIIASSIGFDGAYYAFTPEFLTSRLTFNAGAVVDNESCFGQYAGSDAPIAAAVQATYQAAHAGQYIGWSDGVLDVDADQTEAFLVSREFGGNPADHMTDYVNLTNKNQRPFALTDVEGAMGQETRSPLPSVDTGSATYLQGNPEAPATSLSMVISTFSTPDPATALSVWGLPSISYADIQETATGGTLTLHGYFPRTIAKVHVGADSGGVDLSPTNVTTSTVTATWPANATQTSGLVHVVSAENLISNDVPVTQWSATLQFNTQGALSGFTGVNGSGTGTFAATMNINFRADVHAVIATVDATPQQPNFVFQGVMANSTAALTDVGGSFYSAPGLLSGGDETVIFSMMQPPPTLSWASSTPVSAGQFTLAPVTGQPASCNNAMIGVQPGAANVFCPVAELLASNAVACTNTSVSSPTLCASGSTFGNSLYNEYGSTRAGDGLLIFTLNPADYSVALTSVPAALSINVDNGMFGGSSIAVTGTVTGTVSAPTSPPASNN